MTENGMRSIVVDTNILVSSVLSAVGFSARVLDLWRQRQLQIVISAALYMELVDVLERERIARRYRLWPERKTLLLDGLFADAHWVTPLPETQLPVHCRDSKDDRFLACALAGDCDYLVSGDQDLLVSSGVGAREADDLTWRDAEAHVFDCSHLPRLVPGKHAASSG
jgi:putative PIN family toxin of toxin-antitoxin system